MTEREFGLAAIDDIIRDSVTGCECNSVRWESFTWQFIEAIKSAHSYVDCGAEYGFYVRLALKYGPMDIRITAFEPESTRHELLTQSLCGFPNVKVYPYALADQSMVVEAIKPNSGVSLSINGLLHTHGEKSSVNAVALDDVLQDTPVDVLKVDIEGAEDLAFKGMVRVLKNKPKLFVEWHPADDRVRENTTRLLVSMGYHVDEPIGCGRVVLE